jgi:uracil permease
MIIGGIQMKNYVDVEERLPLLKSIPLSFQHLFAMVGATILVPRFLNMNPTLALLGSGIGTLIYILCTKAKLPAYVGSSFAFIVPIAAVAGKQNQYLPEAMSGIIAAGLVYVVIAVIIYYFGTNWINKLLPPVVVGSVVIVIGLGLAGVAVGWAGLLPAEGAGNVLANKSVWVALFTLAVAIAGSMFFRGFLAVIPVLIGMVSGYLLSLVLGLVDITPIANAGWLTVPKMVAPRFSWNAILAIAPVAIVTITEHIGHVLVTNSVCGRDFTKDPGLHRSILGDGIATSVAGLFGAPPNTTYGENIGVMAITKVYSVWVVGGAAVIAIILSFIGKVGAVLETIPLPVIGGISIMLFGIIASSGLRMLVESGIDFSQKRNLIIASVILVLGIGGAKINFSPNFEISSMALATLVGIFLNLVLPKHTKDETRQSDI